MLVGVIKSLHLSIFCVIQPIKQFLMNLRQLLPAGVLLCLLAFTTRSQAQLSQNFDGSFPPTGWAVFDNANGTGQSWQSSTTTQAGAGAAFVRYESVTSGLARDWMVTPQFLVPTAAELKFYHRQGFSSDYGTKYTIRLSTTSQTDTTTFTTIKTYTEADFTVSYSLATVDLSAYAGQNVYMAFVMTNDDGDNWYIDELEVASPPSCLDPSMLGAYNLTPTGASIYWTGGGATDFNVQYGLDGFALGTGTYISSTNDTTSLSSLTAQTDYDFYVRDSCGVGSVGNWVGPFSFMTPCAAAMSGTYTVNSALATGGTNFASFTAMAKQLNDCGVSGAVTINVVQGTYSEQFALDSIAGASSTNTVTIQADAANTNPVVLTYAATGSADNYVININNADYISISGLTITAAGTTYGRVIKLDGASDHLTFDGNIINGVSSTGTSTNTAVIYNTSGTAHLTNNTSFTNNTITGGTYSFYWYGSGTTTFESGNTISGNTITNFDHYGIAFYYQTGGVLSNNTITSRTGANATVYGISNYYSDNSTVSGNTISVYAGTTAYGVYNYYNDATAGSPNLVANNMVLCSGNSGATYGIYPFNNYYTDVVYNTVLVDAGSATSGRALYINSSSTGTYGFVNLLNNNLVNTGPGYTAEVSSAAVTKGYVTSSNYNNIFGSGATLVRVGSTNYATLSAYQTATSLDANSVNADPLFVSATDLHVLAPALNGAATVIAGITVDIDGDTRNASTPDIGADEFTPPSCLPSTGFASYNKGTNSVSLSWVAGAGTSYTIEYGPAGFTQGGGTLISSIADTFRVVSSLTAYTTYDFYLQDNCSGSNSIWVGPVTVKTSALPLVLPYANDFEVTLVDFENDVTNDDNWVIDTAQSTGTTSVRNEYTASAKNYLILPNPIDLSTYPNAVLTFDHIAKSEGTYDECYVQYSADGGQTWQVIPAANYTGSSLDYATRQYFHEDSYTDWGTTDVAISNSWWKSERFSLGGLSSNTILLRFFLDADGSAQRDGWYIDNLAIFNPSCGAPTSLGATAVTATSADLYWTSGGAANANVEYGTAGFTPGSGTMLMVTNDTVSINNLMPQTQYAFYVQDSCGAGNVSAWVGPFSFTTLCAALTPPQLEDFASGFVPNACWSEATNGNPTSGPTGFGSGDWEVDGFGNVGTTGAVKVNLYDLGTSDWMFTPSYDLTTGGPYQVEFDFGVFAWTSGTTGSAPATLGSDDVAQFLISTNGGATWTSLATYNNTYVTAAGGNHEVFDLTSYAGSTVSFAFYATEGTVDDTEDNDVFVDDFEVKVKPACPDVTGLNVISATDSSVTIYWTAGSGTNWNVQYGDTTGFVLGSGTIIAVTNDTVTINGLSASTTYGFYVQNDCGSGGVSAYSAPLEVTTECAPLPLPYIETFEIASSTSLACVSAQANWSLAGVGGYGGSTNSLLFPFYDVISGTFSAFTPVFAPTPANYQLSVDHAKAAYGTEADSIKIYYSMDAGATYTLLVGLDGSTTGALNTAGATTAQFVPGASDWSTYSIALPVGVNRVRVDAISDYGNDLYLDNLSIDAIPSCGVVTGFGVDTVYGTTGVIYWTVNSNSIGGSVEYGPVGFTPGTGTVVAATNDTLTLSSLMANACYDVYITDTCAGGIPSTLAGPFTFCAACSGSFVAPFFEGFETLGTTIPNCWSTFSTTGEEWRFRNTNLGHSASTGANGSTHFAAFDDSETPITTDGTLETPFIDVTPLNAPAISFYLWSDAEDGSGVAAGFPLNAEISVEVYDGAAWNMLFTRRGNTDGWEQFWVDLTGLNITGPIKARFIVDEDHGGGFDDDISIDDIFFTERPACFDPIDLMVGNIGLNSIELTWTADTTVNTSTIEYGAPGFTLGTGTQVAGGAGMGIVSGLTSSTCYDFYVVDSCSGGFTSWLGPITVCTSTPCAVTTTPTGVNDSTGCGGGYVALSATAGNGNSDVAWIFNGNVIAVSDTVADTIAATTVVQAHDYDVTGVAVHVGPLPSIAPLGFGNFTNGQFITVHDTIYIDSTTVRSDGFVNAQVIIRDAAGVNIIQRGTVFETPATGTVNTQVPVDILLVPGNYFIGIDFDITAVSTGSLFRATTGAVFPYSAPGFLDITGVNFNGPRYYYTFDLVVRGACLGAPTQVIGYVPGASAGNDVTADICETETAVNLAGYLGAHTGGGTWTDLSATGALTDSIFDATVSGPGGPFNFRYVVTGAGGCAADTSFVTLNVDTLLNAGVDASAAFCTSSAAFVALRPIIGADGGGTWADLDNSGILVSDRIRPNQGTPGVYRFEYTQPANGTCPANSAIATITLSAPVDAGADASDTTCISQPPINLASYLSAGVTTGGTWVDVNGSGGLSGAIFTTSSVVGNTTYNFRYVVQAGPGCPDDSATVSIYVCDDISLNEQALASIQLYPNPTNGVFFVEDMDKGTHNFTVEVLSIDGKLLRSFEFANNGKQTVDISALATGVYHVKVTTDKGVRVFKVVAQD
jgi:parallel beta-helix repeat protein